MNQNKQEQIVNKILDLIAPNYDPQKQEDCLENIGKKINTLLSQTRQEAVEKDRNKILLEVGQLFPEEGGSKERQEIMKKLYQYFKSLSSKK